MNNNFEKRMQRWNEFIDYIIAATCLCESAEGIAYRTMGPEPRSLSFVDSQMSDEVRALKSIKFLLGKMHSLCSKGIETSLFDVDSEEDAL